MKQSKKRVPYKKRKKTREEELRLHLLCFAGGAGAVILILVLIFTVLRRGGNRSDPVRNAEESAGATVTEVSESGIEIEAVPDSLVAAAPADAASGAEILASEAAPAEESTSSASIAGAESTAAAEASAAGKAIPIDQQERVITDTSVDWRLILVNPKHMLPEDFWVDTVEIDFAEDEDMLIDYRVADALDEMLRDCRSAGCNPQVRAGYRSQATQEYLYEEKIQEWIDDEGYSYEEAEEVASTIVAYPGTSEHQLGLAADISDRDYTVLNSSQADSPTQQWLMEHCQDYGFILRFPDGKSDLTGIIYEPWHYRYVGKEIAAEIMERGICLEEYLAEKGLA